MSRPAARHSGSRIAPVAGAAAATLRLLPRTAMRLPGLPAALGPRWRGLSLRWRVRLIVLACAGFAFGALYQFWFRDSSFVRVEHVTVTGIDTGDAPRVRALLTEAARHMTTLDLDESALRRAVAGEPIVHSLRLHPDFPHGLRIEVVENRPAARLDAGGRTVAVAPDGTLLTGSRVPSALPAIRLRALPGGPRLTAASVRQLVAVAAAAPVPLLSHITSITRERGRGIVASLRRGPDVWFGLPIALGAKWQAAAAVLARRSSQGASYIDVRMPERPVAGGLTLPDAPQPDAQDGVVPALVPSPAGAAPTQSQPRAATQPPSGTGGATQPPAGTAGTTAGATQPPTGTPGSTATTPPGQAAAGTPGP